MRRLAQTPVDRLMLPALHFLPITWPFRAFCHSLAPSFSSGLLSFPAFIITSVYLYDMETRHQPSSYVSHQKHADDFRHMGAALYVDRYF